MCDRYSDCAIGGIWLCGRYSDVRQVFRLCNRRYLAIRQVFGCAMVVSLANQREGQGAKAVPRCCITASYHHAGFY